MEILKWHNKSKLNVVMRHSGNTNTTSLDEKYEQGECRDSHASAQE